MWFTLLMRLYSIFTPIDQYAKWNIAIETVASEI